MLTLGPHEGVDRFRDLCGDDRPSDELVTAPHQRLNPDGHHGERGNPLSPRDEGGYNQPAVSSAAVTAAIRMRYHPNTSSP